jgi:hypothetical protein
MLQSPVFGGGGGGRGSVSVCVWGGGWQQEREGRVDTKPDVGAVQGHLQAVEGCQVTQRCKVLWLAGGGGGGEDEGIVCVWGGGGGAAGEGGGVDTKPDVWGSHLHLQALEGCEVA